MGFFAGCIAFILVMTKVISPLLNVIIKSLTQAEVIMTLIERLMILGGRILKRVADARSKYHEELTITDMKRSDMPIRFLPIRYIRAICNALGVLCYVEYFLLVMSALGFFVLGYFAVSEQNISILASATCFLFGAFVFEFANAFLTMGKSLVDQEVIDA